MIKTTTQRRTHAPAKWLVENGLITGESVIDFRCGKGKAAAALGWVKYDPKFAPLDIKGRRYRYCYCGYVLNNVSRDTILETLSQLRRLAKTTFISVPRQFAEETQSLLADLAIVRETRSYVIYSLTGRLKQRRTSFN